MRVNDQQVTFNVLEAKMGHDEAEDCNFMSIVDLAVLDDNSGRGAQSWCQYVWQDNFFFFFFLVRNCFLKIAYSLYNFN